MERMENDLGKVGVAFIYTRWWKWEEFKFQRKEVERTIEDARKNLHEMLQGLVG